MSADAKKVIFRDLGRMSYKEAWDLQEELFNSLVAEKKGSSKEKSANGSPGWVLMVEHPHVYTLGKSGSEKNLLMDSLQMKAKNAEFFKIDRGGDITYHGPGQIVGYPIIDLEKFRLGIKEYIFKIEEAIIKTLAERDISGERLDGATGVWLETNNPAKARKICAIGVRASRYVTMHGFAFNVNTNLDYFNWINPCGFTDKGVTSLKKELGREQDIEEIKTILKNKIAEVLNIKWSNNN